MDGLHSELGGRPLVALVGTAKADWSRIRQQMTSSLGGLGSAHVGHLVTTAESGLGVREHDAPWLSQAGWPKFEDPLTVVDWVNGGTTVRTAESRLERLRSFAKSGATAPQVERMARQVTE